MNAQVQTQTTGIATIKPKRKYTKRKAKVVQIKPKVSKVLPKTASAYLRTLGMAVDKESTAVSELIRLHSESKKREQDEHETLAVMTAPAPLTLWDRFKGWLAK